MDFVAGSSDRTRDHVDIRDEGGVGFACAPGRLKQVPLNALTCREVRDSNRPDVRTEDQRVQCFWSSVKFDRQTEQLAGCDLSARYTGDAPP
ncbi:MAG: hypothetical protein JWN03_1677 [Nocardia sp.]|nr:hypothetical protein [Nocardia sp.]